MRVILRKSVLIVGAVCFVALITYSQPAFFLDNVLPVKEETAKTGAPVQVVFTMDDFRAIELGMSRLRVIEILKCPPGDYTTIKADSTDGSGIYDEYEKWKSNDFVILVLFDNTSRVISCCFYVRRPILEKVDE
jgi:hypothetical protein